MQAVLERCAKEKPRRLEGVRVALEAALERLIGKSAAALLVPEGDSWSWGVDLPAAGYLLQVRTAFQYARGKRVMILMASAHVCWPSTSTSEHANYHQVVGATQGLTQLADLRLPAGAELLPRPLLQSLPRRCACRLSLCC